jgi:hypothetical protein
MMKTTPMESRETDAAALEQYASLLRRCTKQLVQLRDREGPSSEDERSDFEETRSRALILQSAAERAFATAGLPTEMPQLPRLREAQALLGADREEPPPATRPTPSAQLDETLDRAHLAIGRLRDPQWGPVNKGRLEPRRPAPGAHRSRLRRALSLSGGTIEKVGKLAGAITATVGLVSKLLGLW